MSEISETPAPAPAVNTGTSAMDIRALNEEIQRESAFVDLINLEMDKVIVGQKHMVERLLIGML
ncbi:MAG: hypothetical protein AAGB22_14320, partial [Bacteroidota bacterium]